MRVFRHLVALVVVAALAACSSGRQYFETEGLKAPPQQCAVKPANLGLAEPISRIDEGNGCEVRNAWRVYSVTHVKFSQPATMACGMASPLDQWIEGSVQPTAQRAFGESVVGFEIAASYACRPRNNQRGAKMSEHGYGNALDISGFILESGRQVSVRDGWNGKRDEEKFLRKVRADACGPFMTVLGPGSDAHHRDHFHLDMQNRRSGSRYCH